MLLAIAVGIGSQYLPARFPRIVMARFSRLPVLGQATVLALALMLTNVHRPGGRGTLHLLPVLMADRPLPQLPPLPEDETRTLEQARPPDVPPPAEPRAPRARDDRPRRKLWSAGHALVVCVLALAIGLLLNAPGVHKSAYNKPAGWERDVALALTGPLAGVSHALLLDRPREGVQAVVGRSGSDEIDTRPRPPTADGSPGDADPVDHDLRLDEDEAEDRRSPRRRRSSRSRRRRSCASGSQATRS